MIHRKTFHRRQCLQGKKAYLLPHSIWNLENGSRDIRGTSKGITSKRKTVNEINIKVIQEVATDIGALVKYTSDIRGKTARIQKITKEIDEDPDGIKDAAGNYQRKLKDTVAEIENHEGTQIVAETQQLESSMVTIR